MKRLTILLLTSLTLLFSGCLVESVFPFYLGSDVVHRPGLEGRWVEQDKGADEAVWEFKKWGEDGYWFKFSEKNPAEVASEGQAHLFQLKDALLLDLAFDRVDKQQQAIPFHLLLKVEQMEPTLKVAMLSDGWMKEQLSKNPAVLRHLAKQDENGKPDNDDVRLTADTPDLRKFLLEHLAVKEMFGDPVEYRRLPK